MTDKGDGAGADAPVRPVVLLIDDEEMALESMAEYLDLYGFHPILAGDVAEAWEKFCREPVVAVLTDLRMPGMDGRTIVARLREADADLPIYVITGNVDMGDESAPGIPGATALFSKPVSMRRVIADLRQRLDPQ